jgi:hypothetical protein
MINFLRCLLLAFYFGLNLSSVQAQDESLSPELKIKIAYLFHFSQFTQWTIPPPLFNYCVYEDIELTAQIKQAYLGKTIANTPISVQTIGEQSDFNGCHLIYFPHSVSNEFLIKVIEKPILTIGTQKNFIALGGIIYLFEDFQKIHFFINNNKAQAVGLKINAQLLSLSKEPPL